MLRLRMSASWLCAALVLVVGSAMAAERSISLLPGTDLPGADYAVEKGISLEACESACVDDRICRAFTYNESARWCFLKGRVGQRTPFDGATSGRVETTPSAEELVAARQNELPFPAANLISNARYFAEQLPNTDLPPSGLGYTDLVASGDEAIAQGNHASALISYRYALAIADGDPALWLKFARAVLTRVDEEARRGASTYDLASTAASAALNGLLQTDVVAERAEAMAILAQALEGRQMWREAIATYRATLALVDDADLQARLDKAVAEHGFRVVSHEVDAEAAAPRICAVFSEDLPNPRDQDLSGYVTIDAGQVAIEPERNQICFEGVEHGRRYAVRLRAGLPAASGESLQKDVDLSVFVPDRSPFVGFANNAYVMPAGLGGGLPITSVNAETADITMYRIGDRAIATAVRNGIFQRSLDGYSAEDVANQYGEKVWEGQVDLARAAPNAMTTTAIPVADALGGMEPGAYVVTARVAGTEANYWDEMATQWFIVTDLGLTTISGDDGVHAFVRSLTSAAPVAGADVRLVARNNEILGEATSDADGRVTFAPGLGRGTGGRAPQLMTVETAGGDYAFLDVAKPAFDLTDRGVDGRPSPGPLDLFATTERGVYRPGETVFLTAILRDTRANAVEDLPLTLELERPDGVVASRELLNDRGAGGYFAALPMVADAMRGSWQIRLYADPKASALASVSFLVEDFEPERLAFEVSAPDAPVAMGAVAEINVAASYLYGATAPDLAVEADVVLRPASTLPDHPGYVFGRLDDPFETYYEPLGTVGVTDEAGNALAEMTIPEPQPTTRPLNAQILLRLVDANGRPVQRSLSRPVLADVDRIGVKPRFESAGGLGEGSDAGFDIITVAPEGDLVASSGLEWRLSRIETSYQWYRDGGAWRWEAITSTREVANGTVDTTAAGPVAVGAPVDWGRYRFEIESTGDGATATSYEFYAGYYYPDAGSDTPDTLEVALDKEAYRPGETASLRLDPQFAGTALVMVVDNRIIDMRAVEVPAEGTTVALPVTEEWGPGAYVTAVLYRPADVAEKRMPARALGLAFADVDPGDRQLDVTLTAPADARPRQSFTATLNLANAVEGETAYVAVAAVDLGILNITNFKVPDPDGWFFGQRQLGVDVRDLYGQLIDPTQGMAGAVRSGGDGGGARLGTPPPTSVLVALHSGVVTVGADGTASVTFDMPDFNGTVRLMAMAWTASAVGHASEDVIVRDPVVVTLSPPRFLRYEDTSRLLVEVTNVAGIPGSYTIELATGSGITTDAAETTVELPVGGRTSLDLGLTGAAIGDHELRLIVTDPNGNALIKALTLGVRAASAPQTATRLIPLAPGETVTLDAAAFAGMIPHTGLMTLAIGPIARLNVPELMLRLDRYPYGCVEQISSRALPLLYLNDVAQTLGLGSDEALDQRIRDAITNVLAKQTSSGGFGLWGPFSGTELWLDAYVTDFLLRARDAGHEVPAQALERALDSLGNQLSYASDFSDGGEGIAYALYDLARAGRAAIGDLRYYLEARLDAFGSPLAKAQLGAALALYGDRTRSATAFAAAVDGLGGSDEDRNRYRPDYGSRLRDAAAILALAAEFKPSGLDLAVLAERLSGLRDAQKWTSTQEEAWTLVAAAALARDAGEGAVMIDGENLEGTVYRRYQQEHFDGGTVSVTNNGNRPTEMTVSVTAIAQEPPPPTEAGFSIWRSYYLPDGTEADFSNVTQNDRFVVVLTVVPQSLGSGQYVVADPLPGGFEIENANLLEGSGASNVSWLSFTGPAHVESRTDQYVAAFRQYGEPSQFSTAYMVRAVSPGAFAHPGATVEDMYRPERYAITNGGWLDIAPAGGGAAE